MKTTAGTRGGCTDCGYVWTRVVGGLCDHCWYRSRFGCWPESAQLAAELREGWTGAIRSRDAVTR